VAAKLFDPAAGRQRVDRYELIGEIASGGMATVYLARLTGVGGFQRFVAMKRLHPHLASEKEFVEMFLDEARLAAGIHHPNVVPILEVGASVVGYYLVMEYIEGDTLARLLARASSQGSRVPPAIVLRVALDMLAGLHAAHELRDDAGHPINLVHRDVSPQNVLVGCDGIARITDFGVARAASRLSATRVGQLKGKIAYMAPEQAQGDDNIDRRADVFSAGVMIWEALASKRLFKADNEAATLSRVMLEPIPQLSRIAPHVSRPVCDVVMRALERDRTKRFMTCAQFADALEASAQQGQKIATARELAAYVQDVIGDDLAGQRDAVRAWLAQGDPSQPEHSLSLQLALPSSSVSAGTMSLPDGSRSVSQPTLPDRPRRSRLPQLAALLVLLCLVGGGGFFAAQYFARPEAGLESDGPRAGAPPQAAPELPAPPPPVSALASAPAAEPSAPPSAAEPATQPAQTAAPVVPQRPRKKRPEETIPVNPYR